MRHQLPPIVKLAERLLVAIEQAVSRFVRRHRYGVGSELRAQAMDLARIAHRAWRDREHRAMWVRQLSVASDEFEITMQLAQRIHAFASFAQFEALARTALNERGYQPDWIERQLAHGDPDSMRDTYNKAHYLPERQAMMQAWADELDAMLP